MLRIHLQVLLATVRHVDWDIVKCLVIAGPGFAKDKFLEFLTAEAVKRELKCVMELCGPSSA